MIYSSESRYCQNYTNLPNPDNASDGVNIPPPPLKNADRFQDAGRQLPAGDFAPTVGTQSPALLQNYVGYGYHTLLISFVSILGVSLSATTAIAQVSGDQTLPNGENTVVNQNGDIYEISDGVTRDTNLFHSFEEFSLGAGQEAFFDHDADIDTILGRVTGGLPSNIDGLISVPDFSTADIFLINPQGIVFGPNASLDIGGSFIASTAEQILFADGNEFSTANPQAVSLTISQPIGLRLGQAAGSIENQAALVVPSEETLALIGNGIEIVGDGMEFENVLDGFIPTEIRLFAPAGRIELASVAPGSFINLIQSDSESPHWIVDVETIAMQDLQNIELFDGAVIDTSSSFIKVPEDIGLSSVSSGSIQLLGRQILIDDSLILAANLGFPDGGGLTAIASEQFTLSGGSVVFDVAVFSGGSGNITIDVSEGDIELFNASRLLTRTTSTAGTAGTLTLNAENLTIQDDSELATATFGEGNSGNLTLNISSTTLVSGASRLLVQSEADATGAAGVLNLNTSRLSVQEKSEISTSTLGVGSGGTLTINAFDETSGGMVELSGGSRLLAQTDATGAAGDLNLNTLRLSMQEGSEISTSTLGAGSGGTLTINALDETSGGTVELSGGSRLLSQSDATGAAGDLSLNTSRLSVQEGSEISTLTLGAGAGGTLTINALDETSGGTVELSGGSRLLAQADATGAAGDLTLTTSYLSVQEGSEISTATLGGGAGGTLTINTLGGVTELVGVSPNGGRSSSLTATTQGTGDAGTILIDTGDLLLQNGGQIQSGTFSSGNGGLTRINAESVIVTGELPDEASSISANAAGNSFGADNTSGAIEITTGSLLIQGEAAVSTSTNSSVQGGPLTVEAEEVILSGQSEGPSGLFARTEASGNSGVLTLTTDTLLIEDGARLTVSTDEDAPIADLGAVLDANITANTITLDNGEISADARSGNGGNLNFIVQDLISLENGSLISATAGTAQAGGNGGNITIAAPDGFIIAFADENNDIIANAFEGTGGNIDITAIGVFGFTEQGSLSFEELRANDTNDISASSDSGTPGIIDIDAQITDPNEGLNELEGEIVNSETLISTSCLATDNQIEGRFVILGSGGLPHTPEDVITSIYPTGDVQTLPVAATNSTTATTAADGWQHGDPIIEPDSITRLPHGRIAFTHGCDGLSDLGAE